jgi:hypothetical protein
VGNMRRVFLYNSRSYFYSLGTSHDLMSGLSEHGCVLFSTPVGHSGLQSQHGDQLN